MNRLNLIFAIGFACFAFHWNCALLAAEGTEPQSTNIVFILVDDLGYGDVGEFFQNTRAMAKDRNRPWHMTPSLDKMAAEGMLMPNQYCSAPVCAPSRASILLGVHQGHANVRDNQFDKALEDNHTIATVLKSAGYTTSAIGKYGLQGGTKSNPPQWPAHPNKRGFDEYYGYIRHVDGHEHYPKNGITKGPKEVWHNATEVSGGLNNCYTTDLFTARAKHFIIEHRKKTSTEPFFLYLAYDTPHAVLSLPTGPYPEGSGINGGLKWLGKDGEMINTANGTPDSYYHPDYVNATWDHDNDPSSAEIAWPDVQKRFATLVRRIDDCVGDLFQTLKDLNIDDNTMVVFTSDNGPSLESYLKEQYSPTFFDSFGPFDGTKRDVWEGGVRVGAIARWPGKIIKGSNDQNHATGSWDWLPTFAEIAGVPAPARCDGVSLVPLLTGASEQAPSKIYIEYFQNGKTSNYEEFAKNRRNRKRNQMQILREGNLVGVRYNIKSHDDDFEIYDIVSDPAQRKNIASSNPDLQQRMKDQALRGRRPCEEAQRPYDEVPIPSLEIAESTPGIRWQFYQGNFAWVPSATKLASMSSGTTRRWSDGTEKVSAPGVMIYHGYLRVPASGAYTFSYRSPSKGVLHLHDALLIDADKNYSPDSEINAEIHLEEGLHPFTLSVLTTARGVPNVSLSYNDADNQWKAITAEQLFH